MPESWWNNKVKVSRHDTNLVKESTFQVKAFLLFLKNENGKENNSFTWGSFDFLWEIYFTFTAWIREAWKKNHCVLLFAFHRLSDCLTNSHILLYRGENEGEKGECKCASVCVCVCVFVHARLHMLLLASALKDSKDSFDK